MKKYLQNLFLFSLPIFLIVLFLFFSYLFFDPFKVTKDYNDYSYSNVILNRDFISTTMFKRNFEKFNYNSFIFGSSRTLAFRPKTWKKYLDTDDNVFMFDASGESIYGIYKKLKFLDSNNIEIKNALIILCRDASFKFVNNHIGHLYIKHPATSGESNFDFHLEFFKAFVSPRFLLNFFSFKILGSYKPFMNGYIEYRKIRYDTITNEVNIIDQELEITKTPKSYYENRKNVFYTRLKENTDTVQRIRNDQIFLLNEINRILIKNNTKYKVVLSPLYEQVNFNSIDLAFLKKLFGENLYDFSGKNRFTDNYMNYYETSHYRPIVGDSILKIIYSNYLFNKNQIKN